MGVNAMECASVCFSSIDEIDSWMCVGLSFLSRILKMIAGNIPIKLRELSSGVINNR